MVSKSLVVARMCAAQNKDQTPQLYTYIDTALPGGCGWPAPGARNRFLSSACHQCVMVPVWTQLVRSCPTIKTVIVASLSSSSSSMSSSDLSPRAKLNYDSDKFLVEFNVSEYSPEVNIKQTKLEKV